MTIKNTLEFNSIINAALSGKSGADYQLQQAADWAINQSIEHKNATPAMHLVSEMQRVKYGNIGAMVKYLVTKGNLEVVKGQVVFNKKEEEMPLVITGMSTKWTAFVKVEKIEQPIDDTYIMLEVQKLLKRATNYAKKHDKKASDSMLNKLSGLVQSVEPVATADHLAV